MAASADLFKYKHSKGRKLDPLSGRFATTEKKKINITVILSYFKWY